MASNTVSIEPVVKTVTVACTPEEAFRCFTADFAMWWPGATHSVVAYASQFKDKPTAVIFEPCISGRIFERTRAGEEYAWGSVLVWQPPTRVAFSFHPGRDAKESANGGGHVLCGTGRNNSRADTWRLGETKFQGAGKPATATTRDGRQYSLPLTPNTYETESDLRGSHASPQSSCC